MTLHVNMFFSIKTQPYATKKTAIEYQCLNSVQQMTGRGELFQMDSLERSLMSATIFLNCKIHDITCRFHKNESLEVTVYVLQGSCECRQLLWSQSNPSISKEIKKIS